MEKLYEDSTVIVETNGCGEIFVSRLDDPDGRIRVSPLQGGLTITSHNGSLSPWSVGGLSAIYIKGRSFPSSERR